MKLRCQLNTNIDQELVSHQSRRVAKHIDVWNAVSETWKAAEMHTFVYDGWNLILETVVDHVAGATNSHYLWNAVCRYFRMDSN